MSKHKAVRTTLDGITFASKGEAGRYAELKLLERAGVIEGLILQKSFELCPAVKLEGAKRASRAIVYRCDFSYFEWIGGKKTEIVEDYKGARTKALLTPIFNLKRHLLKHQRGIDIRIT